MKIFISWSGERSQKVASLLDSWLSCVIQAVEPWLSTKDIDRGALWFTEITNQLASINNGIICLTKSNMNKPWILFEAGALAKGLSSARVFTFLIDLQSHEVKDPLGQFNHTLPTRDGLWQLVRSINFGLGDKMIKDNILERVFDTYWPQFESKFNQILKETPDEEIKTKVDKEEVFDNLFNAVRNIEKTLRDINIRTQTNAAGVDFPALKKVKIDVENFMRSLYENGFSDKDVLSQCVKTFPEIEYTVLMDMVVRIRPKS